MVNVNFENAMKVFTTEIIL